MDGGISAKGQSVPFGVAESSLCDTAEPGDALEVGCEPVHRRWSRLRPSARSRVRLSSDAFEAAADYACFYSAVLTEARQLSTWTSDKEEAVMKSFYQK